MPGIATKFVVADLVMARLLADGAPQAQPLKNSANLPFFYLGALGATFGDLMPARPDANASNSNSPYFKVWLPSCGHRDGAKLKENINVGQGLGSHLLYNSRGRSAR